MSGASELLEEAGIALEAGDVESAVARLADAVELDDPPLAHVMLGGIVYMDDRFPEAREEWERAFAGLRSTGEQRAAARVATDLAELHANTLGNTAAGNGWASRARRLLEQVGPCPEWGYLELAFMACDRPDVDELLESAERALAIAAAFHDVALEVRALADSGLALVTQGRLHEGFDRLDAALAAIAAGEVRDVSVVGKSFCSMLSSCDRVGDVRRAEEWTNLVQAMLLDRFEGRPRVLHTHCLAAYGSVLCRAGRWPEAESALTAVLGPTGSSSFGHRADTAATLALLRVEQGRLDEAAALLEPYEDRVTACVPMARLHLRRNEPEAAAAVLRRGLGAARGRCAARRDLVVVARRSRAGPRRRRRGEIRRRTTRRDRGPCRESCARSRGGHRARTRRRRGRRPRRRGCCLRSGATARRGPGSDRSLPGRPASRSRRCSPRTATSRTPSPRRVPRSRPSNGSARLLLAIERAPCCARSASGSACAIGPGPALLESLTRRESEVLDLVRQGCSNADIAAQLYISPKTAEHHVGRILSKLGVRSRAEAAALAATSTPQK